MGPSPSNFNVTNFNRNNWVVQKENGYCVLLKNKQTGQIVEQYDMLPKGDISIQQQLQFYEYRRNQDRHLVAVIGVVKGDSAGLCTGNNYYKVFTERIPFRLTEIDYLSFPEALMVIRDALVGYDDIKDSYFGSLKVTNEMIGFTPTGEVKVWINEQFKFNTPDKKHIMKGYANSLMMITQIFAIVQESMADKQFPETFRLQMNKLDDNLTYQKAIKFIQEYSIKIGIEIPKKLNILRTSINEMNSNIQVAEPYNINLHPVPITNAVQEVKVPENTYPHYFGNNIPPPVNVPVKSIPQPVIQHNFPSHIPQQVQTIQQPIQQPFQQIHQPIQSIQQRREVRVINPSHDIPNNIHPRSIVQDKPKPQHVRNHSDVVPFQSTEGVNQLGMPDKFFTGIRAPERNIIPQRFRQPQQIISLQRPNHSPQPRGLPHRNIQPSVSPTNYRNPSQPSRNFSYQNPININRTLPAKHQISQPTFQAKLTHNHSSNNLLVHNRASPEYYNKSSTFLEPDTLNQKIDALTANIASMHRELQESTRKNGYY